jgi:uncharacterized protein (TIGR04222 family)
MTYLMIISTLSGAGDTWGLSGPTFLRIYLVLAGCVLIAALVARRGVRSRGPTDYLGGSLGTEGKDGPFLAAYLGGGPKLAVLAALSSLRVAGLVHGQNRRCERTDAALPTRLSGLERAVLAAASDSPTRDQLLASGPVTEALNQLRDELVRRCLLVDDRDRARYRRWGFAMLAVFALGVVRLVAGASDGKPVGYLAFSLGLVAVLTALLWAITPERTTFGDRELARLRAEHQHLSPSMRPDWAANGALAAALAVGMFGAGALWAADPAFAEEVGAKAAGGGDGSGGTWGGGGDSGGSSCGGGGGCGGGGYGGGGCGG